LPFEERYRSYVQVFPVDEVQRLLRLEGAARPTGSADAFRHAGGGIPFNRMLVVDAETQLPDDLLMLTDKMSMAVSLECRVTVSRSRAGRARCEHAVGGEDSRREAQACPEGGGCQPAAARHPRAQETRLRHADGRLLKEDLAPLVRGLLSESVVNRRGLFHSSRVQELIASHEAIASMVRTGSWRCSTSKSGLACTWTAGRRRRDRRTEGDAGMKILYLCHRFPFPPKRGGRSGHST